MDNLMFHAWSLQKTHDELMRLGHTEIAASLRNQCHGLHWAITGGQLAEINGVLARAKTAIDGGRRGTPSIPPDGTPAGARPSQFHNDYPTSKDWDVLSDERKVA